MISELSTLLQSSHVLVAGYGTSIPAELYQYPFIKKPFRERFLRRAIFQFFKQEQEGVNRKYRSLSDSSAANSLISTTMMMNIPPNMNSSGNIPSRTVNPNVPASLRRNSISIPIPDSLLSQSYAHQQYLISRPRLLQNNINIITNNNNNNNNDNDNTTTTPTTTNLTTPATPTTPTPSNVTPMGDIPMNECSQCESDSLIYPDNDSISPLPTDSNININSLQQQQQQQMNISPTRTSHPVEVIPPVTRKYSFTDSDEWEDLLPTSEKRNAMMEKDKTKDPAAVSILVAEDNLMNQKVIQKLLKSMGKIFIANLFEYTSMM